MLAGSLLFNHPLEVLKYALTASSSPLVLDQLGFSVPCVAFLREILQPIPENRPSTEDCQKKPWIMNEVLVPEYSIGKGLYTRLSKINRRAPDVHSLPDMIVNRALDSSSVPWNPFAVICQLRQGAGRKEWLSSVVLSQAISLSFLSPIHREANHRRTISEHVSSESPTIETGISSSSRSGHRPSLHFLFSVFHISFLLIWGWVLL